MVDEVLTVSAASLLTGVLARENLRDLLDEGQPVLAQRVWVRPQEMEWLRRLLPELAARDWQMTGLTLLVSECPWEELDYREGDLVLNESHAGYAAGYEGSSREVLGADPEPDEIPLEERMSAPSWARPLALR